MFLMIGLGLVMTGCEGTSAESSAAEGASKPNIVLIMADDMGYGDPDSYNKESKVPTPNIDRLARQGRRFTDAHTPSSVCTVT
jgi:arylsulfatase A-like enzyme